MLAEDSANTGQETFKIEPSASQTLLDDLQGTVGGHNSGCGLGFSIDPLRFQVDFFLTQEEKAWQGGCFMPCCRQVKIEDVENYEETLAAVEKQLRDLCDPDKARDGS